MSYTYANVRGEMLLQFVACSQCALLTKLAISETRDRATGNYSLARVLGENDETRGARSSSLTNIYVYDHHDHCSTA